jgi:chromosome segregation ATPase
MTRTVNHLLRLGLALLLFAASAQAQQDAATTKLREQLRTALLQLRTAQAERDTLAAAKTQLEQDKTALQQKFDALVKQSAEDKAASDKTIAGMDAKIAGNETQIAQLRESLEKWKASQTEAVQLAKKTEAERQRLDQRRIELERQVAEQKIKNTEMFRIGNEILTRYEKFGLGTAITAREPFVGVTRVKLQNLVQDYGDKLADQKIKPQEKPQAR